MAIKGLSELLAKHRNGELDEATFEAELNKALAPDWIPKTKFNEVSEARKLAETNLANANKTLEDLKAKAGLSDEYKAQISKLTEDNAKAQEEFKAQMKKFKMDSAIENALSGAKARNHKATRALIDEAKISLNDDGTLSGLNEQIEALRKENEFLFETEQTNKGGSNPLWGGGKQTPQTPGGNSLSDQMLAVAGLK